MSLELYGCPRCQGPDGRVLPLYPFRQFRVYERLMKLRRGEAS